MDEIVCANTAFRYWRCPPQVRDMSTAGAVFNLCKDDIILKK